VGHVSIHAARAGGDPTFIKYYSFGIVSIHAARAGGDCPPLSSRAAYSKAAHFANILPPELRQPDGAMYSSATAP
jgi:hypothetical protein